MNVNADLNNGSEWELSKENVQPLKRGRKVANLTAALGSSSNDYQSKIHREKQAFEADIRTYEGDDPLEVWYRYFLWLCENFPTGGKDQITLLERCITVFKDEEKYKNDQRYLEIWMRYADLCSDPMEVYEYMHSQSVCSQLANFYRAWAYNLEELGNMKKADEVYTLGIAKNAQPLEVLQRQHRAFERRLAENVTRDTVQNFNNENEIQRTALGGLKSHGKKGTVGVKRTGSATLSSKVGGFGYSKMSGNSKNAGFTVYCEDENMSGMSSLPPSTGEWQVPPTKPITTKENTQKAGKWTESKLPQKHQRTVPVDNVGTKPSFTVHVDDDILDHPPCTPKHGHVVMDKVLSSRKPEKDPTSELLRNIAKGDNEEKKFKVMYCKDKIYAGAREFSFEQLRAARMLSKLNGRPWSSLYPEQENQDEKKIKAMYPKHEVYTFDRGERPLDEVLLKRYFKHKKSRQENMQSMGAPTQQVCTNTMIDSDTDMPDEDGQPMDYQEIKPTAVLNAPNGSMYNEDTRNLAGNGPAASGFQVYNEETRNLAGNGPAASGFQVYNEDTRNLAGNGPAASGFQVYDEDTRNLAGNGPAASGFQVYNEDTRNLAGNGPAASGFQVYNEDTRNLAGNGPVASGFQVYNEDTRNLAGNGPAASGFQVYDEDTRNLAGNGPVASGFQVYNEDTRNLAGNGPAASGFQVYNEDTRNLAGNGPAASGFQVYSNQGNHSENHAARRGLSFNDATSEGQSSLKDKIYHEEFPNSVPDSALPITGGMSSAFKPVPKGLQTRPALRDRTVPHEEPCSTAVNTSNHSNRVPVTMTTEMQHNYPTLPPNSNIFNTLNQQSAFHQVTPGSKGVVDAFGRHTPGSHTPGSIDNYYPSPTVNTKAAQEAVLAMFNNPLGVASNEDLPWMNRHQVPGPDKDFEAAFCNDNRTENIGTGPFGMQVPSFTPYVETEADKQGHEDKIDIYDENQENRPPSDYVQEKSKRPVFGVLQPSVGIPVCPLEEENDQDMGDEDDENLPPLADQYDKTIRDVTEDANAFMATSSFKMAAHMASTPFSQGLDLPSFVMSTIKPPIEHELEFASAHVTEEYTANTFNCTPNKVLSPIFERSDEDTRSTTCSSTSTISSGRGSVSHHMPPTASQLASIAEEHSGNHGNHSIVRQASTRLESSLFHHNEDGMTDLNPFSDEVVEALLQRVVPPVSSYDGYYSSQKDQIPKIAPNLAVNLGDDDLYQVERCIGTGAFSKVFCAIKLNAHLSSDDFSDDNEVTLKVQKTSNDWEFYVCRQLHTRIDQMECGRNMHALFMKPSDVCNYIDGSVLVDQYDRAVTLLDVANKYKSSGKTIDERVAVLFAISLLRMLRTMHRCNIIHGDFKPDNILVLDSESFEGGMDLKLIDFGRSIDMQLFPPGTSFNVNCYTDGFQCIEMKTKTPWTTQVDTYGLLGTLYCLINGEYMKEYQSDGRWKQNKSFKRHWNTKLWTKLFDSFLNGTGQNDTLSLTEQFLEDFEDLRVELKGIQQARKEHDILMNSS